MTCHVRDSGSRSGAGAGGGRVVCMCGEEASLLVVSNQTSANIGELFFIIGFLMT